VKLSVATRKKSTTHNINKIIVGMKNKIQVFGLAKFSFKL
jgi:hypothetical protein